MEERFEAEIIEDRVDNLFFSKKDNKNLDMDRLCQYLQGNELYYPSYVHELFFQECIFYQRIKCILQLFCFILDHLLSWEVKIWIVFLRVNHLLKD